MSTQDATEHRERKPHHAGGPVNIDGPDAPCKYTCNPPDALADTCSAPMTPCLCAPPCAGSWAKGDTPQTGGHVDSCAVDGADVAEMPKEVGGSAQVEWDCARLVDALESREITQSNFNALFFKALPAVAGYEWRLGPNAARDWAGLFPEDGHDFLISVMFAGRGKLYAAGTAYYWPHPDRDVKCRTVDEALDRALAARVVVSAPTPSDFLLHVRESVPLTAWTWEEGNQAGEIPEWVELHDVTPNQFGETLRGEVYSIPPRNVTGPRVWGRVNGRDIFDCADGIEAAERVAEFWGARAAETVVELRGWADSGGPSRETAAPLLITDDDGDTLHFRAFGDRVTVEAIDKSTESGAAIHINAQLRELRDWCTGQIGDGARLAKAEEAIRFPKTEEAAGMFDDETCGTTDPACPFAAIRNEVDALFLDLDDLDSTYHAQRKALRDAGAAALAEMLAGRAPVDVLAGYEQVTAGSVWFLGSDDDNAPFAIVRTRGWAVHPSPEPVGGTETGEAGKACATAELRRLLEAGQ